MASHLNAKWWRSLAENWLPVMAAFSGATTLGLASFDKTSSSAVTAGFTIALVLAHNLPFLETFKGWGVEAKLREVKSDLGKAEQILKKIDFVSGSLGVSVLNWIYYVGRFGSPSWEEKANLMVDIRKLFDGRDLPPEIVDMEQEIFGLVGWRHAQTFFSVVIARAHSRSISTEKLPKLDEDLNIFTKDDLRSRLNAMLASISFSAEDEGKMKLLMERLILSFDQHLHLQPGSYDSEMGRSEDLYRETFGEAL